MMIALFIINYANYVYRHVYFYYLFFIYFTTSYPIYTLLHKLNANTYNKIYKILLGNIMYVFVYMKIWNNIGIN